MSTRQNKLYTRTGPRSDEPELWRHDLCAHGVAAITFVQVSVLVEYIQQDDVREIRQAVECLSRDMRRKVKTRTRILAAMHAYDQQGFNAKM